MRQQDPVAPGALEVHADPEPPGKQPGQRLALLWGTQGMQRPDVEAALPGKVFQIVEGNNQLHKALVAEAALGMR